MKEVKKLGYKESKYALLVKQYAICLSDLMTEKDDWVEKLEQSQL